MFDPYEMEMQVSRGMDTEVSEEDVVCGAILNIRIITESLSMA